MFKQQHINEEVQAYLGDKKYTTHQTTILSQHCDMSNIDNCIDESFSLGNYNELIDLDTGARVLADHINANNLIVVCVDYDADKL